MCLWFQPIKLEGVVTFMASEAEAPSILEDEEAQRLGRKQERAEAHKGPALLLISPPATYRSTPTGNHKRAPPAGDLLRQHMGLRGHFIRTIFAEAVLCLTVLGPVIPDVESITVGTCDGRNEKLKNHVSTTHSKQRDNRKRG